MTLLSKFDRGQRPITVKTVKAGLLFLAEFLAYSSYAPRLINKIRVRKKRNVVFIWIPKSAGTSVFNWLHEEVGMIKLEEPFAVRGGFPGSGPVTFGHMDTSLLVSRGFVKEQFLRESFCFTIVRNPYTRARSLYNYLTRLKRFDEDFTSFLQKLADSTEPIGLFNSRGLSQANPQCRWVMSREGRMITNRIFKLEDLDNATIEISHAIGATGSPGYLNRSTDKIGDLKPVDVDLIRKIYAEDFTAFKYSNDPDDLK